MGFCMSSAPDAGAVRGPGPAGMPKGHVTLSSCFALFALA